MAVASVVPVCVLECPHIQTSHHTEHHTQGQSEDTEQDVLTLPDEGQVDSERPVRC